MTGAVVRWVRYGVIACGSLTCVGRLTTDACSVSLLHAVHANVLFRTVCTGIAATQEQHSTTNYGTSGVVRDHLSTHVRQAWQALCRTVSRAFQGVASGCIRLTTIQSFCTPLKEQESQ